MSSAANLLKLYSPLRGWCASLDETPDEVFAQRFLGDGVAIDPTGDTLHSPCDGEIVSLATFQACGCDQSRQRRRDSAARGYRYGCVGRERI